MSGRTSGILNPALRPQNKFGEKSTSAVVSGCLGVSAACDKAYFCHDKFGASETWHVVFISRNRMHR